MNFNYVPKYIKENLNYQPGEIVKSIDYNRNLNLLNVAVDNNTEALKHLLNIGGISALSAASLDGAALVRHRDYELQDNDEQVPSSKSVYQYVAGVKEDIDDDIKSINDNLDAKGTEMFNINKRIQVVNSLISQQGTRFNEIETDYEHIVGTMRGGATGQVLAKNSSNPLDYTWTNLLPGPKGDPGYTPIKGVDYFDGADGEDGYTPIKGVDYFDGEDGEDGYTPIKNVDYFDGADGAPGVGVPMGGTTGQALVKASTTDYDVEWSDISQSGGGAYYFIPSTEGTTSNPIIISEKPVGTYYFLDSIGQPSGKTTAYFKRTPTSTRFSAAWMTNLNIIESNIDTITDENVVVGTYETSDGACRALLTKNNTDGFKISPFFNAIVSTNSAQSISGVKTFTNLPKSSVAPTEIEHLVNKEYVDNQLSNLMNIIYPIGSIYMSATSDNPGVLFGGTWVEWGAGRVPVGVDASDTDFDTVEKTGGSKLLQEHTHTATTNSTGAHTHSSRGYYTTPGGSTSRAMANKVISGDPLDTSSILSAGAHSHTITVANAGGGDAQNLQPYITCYMWKRTA